MARNTAAGSGAFAEELARLLDEMNVSQKGLARRIAGEGATEERIENVRRNVIKWLGAEHEPTLESALTVAVALGLAADYFEPFLTDRTSATATRREELNVLRGELEELRVQVGGLAEEVQRLRQVRAPGSAGKPPSWSTHEHPGGDA